MSRVEKFRKHREGNNNIVESEIVDIDQSFEINPISNNNNLEAKRKKSYESSKNSVNLTNLKSNNQKVNDHKIELFDIEVAFKNIERKRKEGHVDPDTQAQIISELFSKDFKKYQDITYEKDEDTKKILISEDELIKLLDKREKINKRENKFQKYFNKFFRKDEKIILEENEEEIKFNKVDNKKFIKENDQVINEVSEEKSKEVDYSEMMNGFNDKNYNNEKSSKLLISILMILIVCFIFLIYMFFR